MSTSQDPQQKTPTLQPESSVPDKVQDAAGDLIQAISDQFSLSAAMAAIDIKTTADMNLSAEAFYAALHERLNTLLDATKLAHRHATAAHPFANDIAALLQKAKHLEAVVDRLDEYTSKQEAALRRTSPSRH